MTSRKHSSLDEKSIAALRRLTRTPTGHRFILRRSGASSSSSSSASVDSFESEKQLPCVGREISSDDCALHKFIIWAAVKRNTCTQVTAEERRRCPLIRCRKLFADHELMLRHLYSCEKLDSGEYWCYDCEKIENIHSTRDQRCPGQPSRRRRLLTLAKSVFSSLGKAKAAGPAPLASEMVNDLAYCNSTMSTAQQQFEIHSNEIHEIGTSGVSLASISEDLEFPQASHSSQSPAAHTKAACPLTVDSGQLTVEILTPLIDESLINWPSPQMSPVRPAESGSRSPDTLVAKPKLQVDTSIFDHHRPQPSCQTNFLAPKSSMRSTDSSASTNSPSTPHSSNSSNSSHSSNSFYSSNSSHSFTSSNITPKSAWSGKRGLSHDHSSVLTSPADVIPDAKDALHCRPALKVIDTSTALAQLVDGTAGFGGLFELPADIPTDLDTSELVEDTSPSEFPSSSNKGIDWPLHPSMITFEPSQSVNQLHRVQKRSGAHKIVQSVRDTLELHFAESKLKLSHVVGNVNFPLAAQFFNMSSRSIATLGLAAMSEILRGAEPSSSINLLCFVHLIYAQSIVVHEQSDIKWWTALFDQCISYSSSLAHVDRFAYIQVAELLWKPQDMTDKQMFDLLKKKNICQPSPFQNCGRRSTDLASSVDIASNPLVFVSEYFLDELEYAALQDDSRPAIQASNLCIQHLKDPNLATVPNSVFVRAARRLIMLLCREYHAAYGFVANMDELVRKLDSKCISSVRRLELELVHRGKLHLPSRFDEYFKTVRARINLIQAQNNSHCLPRSSYQQLGIELTAIMMEASLPSAQPTAQSTFTIMHQKDTLESMTKSINTACFFNDDWPSPETKSMEKEGSLATLVAGSGLLSNQQDWLPSSELSTSMIQSPSTCTMQSTAQSSGSVPSPIKDKVEAGMRCEICGYMPKGDPKWFHGSMAKHKKTQHASSPPTIYACPFPGCSSRYKNRPDNLRQHQIEKCHFLDGQNGYFKGRKRKRKS